MAVNVGGSRRELAGLERSRPLGRLVLAPSPTSPASAREFLRAALSDCDEHILEVLAVLTSELVTNAVLQAATTIRMEVRRSGGRIRVEVSDRSTEQPVLRAPTTEEGAGRGLLIVSALAESWGVDSVDGESGCGPR